jgi:hypothetical protein
VAGRNLELAEAVPEIGIRGGRLGRSIVAAGGLEHGILDEEGSADAEGDGNSVAGPGVNGEEAGVDGEVEFGVVDVVQKSSTTTRSLLPRMR